MSLTFYRQLPNIQAMTFDLDDTLYDNYPVIQNLEQEVLTWLAQKHPQTSQINAEQWREYKLQVLQSDPMLRHNVTLWRQTSLDLGLKKLGLSDSLCQEIVTQTMQQVMILRHKLEVPEKTHQVLTQLKAKYPLIAITNGNLNPEKVGLGAYFDLVLSAGKDGRMKPYPDMFETALKKLDMPAKHVLHVGDHLISDVQGAKQMGMSACFISTYVQGISERRATSLPDIEISQLEDLLLV